MTASPFAARATRAREAMHTAGVDVLLLSLGADLPWLTGYHAMPLERLTMLVFPLDGEATLVVPKLEAPRVEEQPEVFGVRPFAEEEDPVALVASLVAGGGERASCAPTSGGAHSAGGSHAAGVSYLAGGTHSAGGPHIAISDRTWATFLLGLEKHLPQARWTVSSQVTGPLRAIKDAAEINALAAASAAADRVATQLLAGDIPLVGRTEKAVSDDISRRLIAEGHQAVNFAIVGSGPNSASPHHEPGDRIIGKREAVVCDFGGTMDGYCSDTTRTVFTGDPTEEFAELYSLLETAQANGVAAAKVGERCESVDDACRSYIDAGGMGEWFIHRTGHGIGLEEHEDPYIAAGNNTPLVAGHAFSVEPGIYIPGRYGARIEDIVVATELGPRALNKSDHSLHVVT